MVKVNGKCFSNMYDASKYVMKALSEKKKVIIRTVDTCEPEQVNKLDY